jgi:DnaD/phage-associated family protein
MSEIQLHSEKQNASTSISNTFIDEYMSGANGEFVKIYLYLLRLTGNPDMTFSISSIADKFEHTEKDVKRALSYWEKMHLLRLEYDSNKNITGICLLDSASLLPVGAKEQHSDSCLNAPQALAPQSEPSKKSYSQDDILALMQDENVSDLLFVAEQYLGRTLSSTDLDTFFYLYEELGFSADMIEYLVESCVSAGHKSIHYIEKVALNWHQSGITTVAEAKAGSRVYSKAHYAVMNAFGITGRNPVPVETDYIDKWTGKLGFSLDVILEACRRTIAAIHQPSFPYADSILENWNKQHVHHISDIAKVDSERQASKKKNLSSPSAAASAKNKFNNFSQRPYDYDQLEKLLLTTQAR